jgi:transcriptional regulator with XRE-family HTH domain
VPFSNGEYSNLMVFGKNLRDLRRASKLSQEQLAELADLHPRALQKIEAGDVNVTLNTLLRIQKALGCSWETLFRPFARKGQ